MGSFEVSLSYPLCQRRVANLIFETRVEHQRPPARCWRRMSGSAPCLMPHLVSHERQPAIATGLTILDATDAH
jgi:hypothetical protein